jgi:hypothetical protein
MSTEPQKIFRDKKTITAFNHLGERMKNLLSLGFAVVLGVACFVPAPASAYYYRGRYYRYSYRGHYYQYHYRGHYYRHRAWVVGVNGRAGYYRYW